MSQQGKEYTPEQIDSIFAKLEPFLKLGMSLHKSVIQYNEILAKDRKKDPELKEENIKYRTIARYVKENEHLAEKVEAWGNYLEIISKDIIKGALEDDEPDLNTAKWYLEKRVPDEFGNKMEHSGVIDTGAREVAEALRKIIETDEEE
jgi:predicted nucleotidyltransferase